MNVCYLIFMLCFSLRAAENGEIVCFDDCVTEAADAVTRDNFEEFKRVHSTVQTHLPDQEEQFIKQVRLNFSVIKHARSHDNSSRSTDVCCSTCCAGAPCYACAGYLCCNGGFLGALFCTAVGGICWTVLGVDPYEDVRKWRDSRRIHAALYPMQMKQE